MEGYTGGTVASVTESRTGRSTEISGQESRGYALAILAATALIALLYWARIVFITATVAVIRTFLRLKTSAPPGNSELLIVGMAQPRSGDA